MRIRTSAKTLKTQQRRWAERHGIEIDSDAYGIRRDDNLLGKLSAAAQREFDRGWRLRTGKRWQPRETSSSPFLRSVCL